MSVKTSEKWKRLAKKHWYLTDEDQFVTSRSSTARLKEQPTSIVEVKRSRFVSHGTNYYSWSYVAVLFLLVAAGITWRKTRHSKHQWKTSAKWVSAAYHVVQKRARLKHQDQSANQSTAFESRQRSGSPKRTLLQIRKDPDTPEVKRRRKDDEDGRSFISADRGSALLEQETSSGTQCKNFLKTDASALATPAVDTSCADSIFPCREDASAVVIVDDASESFKKEADEVARNILLAQGSFSEHGLPAELAAEFAMKKHFADRSDISKMHIEVVRQQLEERRHQETTSAMYFDHDWQDKLTRARDDCIGRILQSASYALALAAVLEIYLSCPNVSRFRELLLDCACGETVVQSSSLTRRWFGYGYQWYLFFLPSRDRLGEPGYWSGTEVSAETATSIFVSFSSLMHYTRCFAPYIAWLLAAWLLRFVGLRLPQWAQNGVLLVWFLHSEFATLGIEALGIFARYHLIPQIGAIASCVLAAQSLRSATARTMRRLDPSGFHRATFEASLESFDTSKTWFTILPFLCVVARLVLWFGRGDR